MWVFSVRLNHGKITTCAYIITGFSKYVVKFKLLVTKTLVQVNTNVIYSVYCQDTQVYKKRFRIELDNYLKIDVSFIICLINSSIFRYNDINITIKINTLVISSNTNKIYTYINTIYLSM